MDKTLNEKNFLNTTCWVEYFQPLSNDMTKGKNSSCYRFGLDS